MTEQYANKWYAFIGVALLSFGCYLDYTVVNIALPTIQRELQINLTALQWVMNIYFLALCILTTTMGRVGDLYGRRRWFYIGTGIFALASIIAGLAPDIEWLIFGRLLQGVGAALVFPLGLSLLPESFPKEERGKAVAWLGSLGGFALALGPVAGGVIVTYWGWRWIFFINIPITLLGYLFCYKTIKESLSAQIDRTLDWKGVLLLALTIGGLVLSVIHSQTSGWTDSITLMLAVAGCMAGVMLVIVEHKQKNPLIDFSDFSKLLFYAGATLCFLAGVMSAATLFFDPLYLQVIREQSPELSGLVLFAIPIAVLVVALIMGWLVSHLKIVNTIILGLFIAALAAVLQIFFTKTTPLGYIVFAFICLGSMWAMGNTVSIIAAQTAAGAERVSVATGTMVTMFNMGGSIGLAIAVVIYNSVGSAALEDIFQARAAQFMPDQLAYLRQLLFNPAHSLHARMSDLMHTTFHDVFMQGFAGVMWFLLILSSVLLGSVLIWKILANNNLADFIEQVKK